MACETSYVSIERKVTSRADEESVDGSIGLSSDGNKAEQIRALRGSMYLKRRRIDRYRTSGRALLFAASFNK
jgi:hypothetical protein